MWSPSNQSLTLTTLSEWSKLHLSCTQSSFQTLLGRKLSLQFLLFHEVITTVIKKKNLMFALKKHLSSHDLYSIWYTSDGVSLQLTCLFWTMFFRTRFLVTCYNGDFFSSFAGLRRRIEKSFTTGLWGWFPPHSPILTGGGETTSAKLIW